ncbi:phospho-N-acetylmuramoyl-pentapeptide-transferase [Tessaracoccus sp. ZS01]|uniref:phospho-N-acetylmuramoyl-pentapeptide- transferase n=1 Tax=Tessaracoccus sp. ZS01 TaxID=1906324 RepID=UPI00096FAEAF|nr:phospho-N-acetylmuramoyl-pentapeptide-transferase [Tessaracoccus sp. ZS01]MCG6566178.1 phospho-N-acetylmuramoyl-pentapeptide-transferase [Tessaracoccus sp. ZS01]OMG58669.1 phospho-N-acetylmuramoyl-pentapeptide-transferase [Tessaracoccus sp. ZS01]
MINILTAGSLSLLFSLIGTPLLIKFLTRRQYGQFIREDGPTTHHVKRGTPTMGGLVIIVAVVLAYTVTHLVRWQAPTVSGLLLIGLAVGMGFLGFLDDWSKISKERSLGLTPRGKLIGQALIGGGFAVAALTLPNHRGITPASPAISFLRDIPWLTMPLVLAVLFIVFLIAAWSNAVNITDGLDGLAAGSATLVFAAYTIVNIWQFNQWCSRPSVARSMAARCYEVRDPNDLAVLAIAFAGATFGFLWWNAKPAKIFMGDTGSMAIGATLAGLSVMTRTELLLLILGLLFVIEVGSVALQVSYFKATKGKRIFKMSPIHHHFELKGWDEVTVVIRFWIICGLCVAAGMGVFYAEWVTGS